MPPSYPNRSQVMSDVVYLVGRHWTLARVAAMPGMPSRQTMRRWAQAHPTFELQLAEARAGARWERRADWAAGLAAFDAALAEAFLRQVSRGEAVRDLVRRPEGPHRARLNSWKAARPEFASALEAAVREGRRARGRALRERPVTEREEDALLVRLARGETLPQARRAEGVPGRYLARRWREADPEFAAAYEAAKRIGQRRRMRAKRSKLTRELVDTIVERIQLGDSLHSLAKRPGMPHHVTMYGWIRSRPEFAKAVRQACADREDILSSQRLMRAEGASPRQVARAMARIDAVVRRVSTMPRWPGGPARSQG